MLKGIGGYNIAADSKTFDILSGGIYSDIQEVIVRELCANAYDSHVSAGKKDVPFKVTIPSNDFPFFVVEDEGIGLSEVELAGETRILTDQDGNEYEHFTPGVALGFFNSTKQNNEEVIGEKGLGMKSPLAYAPNFSITTRYDGVEYCYNYFKNDEGIPDQIKMYEIETNAPNGVKVVVPVNHIDIQTFTAKIKNILYGYDVLPELINDSEDLLSDFKVYRRSPIRITSLIGDRRTPSYYSDIRIRMGVNYYESEATSNLLWKYDKRGVNSSDESATRINVCDNVTYFIDIDNKALPVTASRERLVSLDIDESFSVKQQAKNKILIAISAIEEELNGLNTISDLLDEKYNFIESIRRFRQKHIYSVTRSNDKVYVGIRGRKDELDVTALSLRKTANGTTMSSGLGEGITDYSNATIVTEVIQKDGELYPNLIINDISEKENNKIRTVRGKFRTLFSGYDGNLILLNYHSDDEIKEVENFLNVKLLKLSEIESTKVSQSPTKRVRASWEYDGISFSRNSNTEVDVSEYDYIIPINRGSIAYDVIAGYLPNDTRLNILENRDYLYSVFKLFEKKEYKIIGFGKRDFELLIKEYPEKSPIKLFEELKSDVLVAISSIDFTVLTRDDIDAVLPTNSTPYNFISKVSSCITALLKHKYDVPGDLIEFKELYYATPLKRTYLLGDKKESKLYVLFDDAVSLVNSYLEGTECNAEQIKFVKETATKYQFLSLIDDYLLRSNSGDAYKNTSMVSDYLGSLN